MAKYADAVVLFPGGLGTENMLVQAINHNLKIFDWRDLSKTK
jgi:predicted Rossmann-fold nucleotide-binding protein